MRPRMTLKYIAAFDVAKRLNLPPAEHAEMYRKLEGYGYFWDALQGEWELNTAAAAAPTDLIRVRVMADAAVVEEAAGQIRANLADWLDFVEQSEPYPCRPPKQLESRIYLTFRRRE